MTVWEPSTLLRERACQQCKGRMISGPEQAKRSRFCTRLGRFEGTRVQLLDKRDVPRLADLIPK
jgi:hypothetical protein